MPRTQAQQPLPFRLVPDDWRIDEHTREVGRRGLAEARAALSEAARRAAQKGDLTQRRAGRAA